MAKIISAKVATEIAIAALPLFASKKPVSAKLTETLWHVEIDVGILSPKLIEVEMDAETGRVKRMR